jgi:hypothetical protein
MSALLHVDESFHKKTLSAKSAMDKSIVKQDFGNSTKDGDSIGLAEQ